MNGISIEEDDEGVTVVLARIDDDNGSPNGRALEVGEQRGKKETGKTREAANIDHDNLQFEVETAQPFMLICTRRIEDVANEQGQPREFVCQRLSCWARYHDIMQRGMESGKLTPKDTPALFEQLDCMRRSTIAKTRRERVYCEGESEIFEDDEMLRQ